MEGSKTGVLIGALVAIIGQFWGADWYLPLIGGIIAGASALMAK